MNGRLTGVGVGPGDPELLTFKAVRLIQAAPVLAYTVDARGESFARRTAASYIRTDQEELPLCFSMSTNRDERLLSRREAAEKVLALLAFGRDVVFITEGDPLLYSTFQHLLAAMPPEIPVEVCPGISAMSAAAAAASFPLVIEGETLIVTPAETALGHLHEWLGQGSSVVLYKVARCLQEIRALNLPCEAVLVQRASTAGEVVIRRVEEWPEGSIPYFSIALLHPYSASGRNE